jgi:hypothetical protein
LNLAVDEPRQHGAIDQHAAHGRSRLFCARSEFARRDDRASIATVNGHSGKRLLNRAVPNAASVALGLNRDSARKDVND